MKTKWKKPIIGGLCLASVVLFIVYPPGSYTPVDLKVSYDQLVGEWKMIHSDYHDGPTKIEIGHGSVIVSNFPDLKAFRDRTPVNNFDVHFIDGPVGATITMAPRGWALRLHGNDLRICAKWGRYYLVQKGNVSENKKVVYKKI